jgi:hypothetical protein
MPHPLPQNIFFVHSRQLSASANPVTVDPADQSYEHTQQLHPLFVLRWTLRESDNEIDFEVRTRAAGWAGFGLSPEPNTMKGADIVFMWNNPLANSFSITDRFAQVNTDKNLGLFSIFPSSSFSLRKFLSPCLFLLYRMWVSLLSTHAMI